jgi:hypothetical protein
MNMPSSSLRALLEKQGRDAKAEARDREEEYEPFANGRVGNKPQLTLVFRKADGSVLAIAYSYLCKIQSDNPALGFVMDFAHAKVEVRGRNLERLFQLVCQHKAVEIVEAARNQVFDVSQEAPLVEEIIVKVA